MVQVRSLLFLAAARLASASLSVSYPYQPSGPLINIQALYGNGQNVYFDIGSGVFGAVTDIIDAAQFTYDTATGYIFVGATTGVVDWTLLTVPDTLVTGFSAVTPSLESATAVSPLIYPLQCTLGTPDATTGIADFDCTQNLPSPLNALCVNIVAGIPIFVAYQEGNIFSPFTCPNPVVSLNAKVLPASVSNPSGNPSATPCSVTVQVTVVETTQFVTSGFVAPSSPASSSGLNLAGYGCEAITTYV